MTWRIFVAIVFTLLPSISFGQQPTDRLPGVLANPSQVAPILSDSKKLEGVSNIKASFAPLGIAEVVLGGMIVGDLIKQFEEAASRLLFEGENRGNALLVTLGNQLRVAIKNAELAMERQQRTLFDNLNVTQQTFFTNLNAVIRAASGPIDRAITILEVANLDLIELVNQLPLTDKTYTYINKISGLTQVHQKTTYTIELLGLGFGQDREHRQYRLSARLGDTLLPASALSRTPPYTLRVTLDNALMEKLFADDDLKTTTFTVSADVTARDRCWLVFRCRRSLSAEWPMKLILLPRYPGELSGEEIIVGQALDGNTKATSVSVTTAGCSTKRPCDWTREIQLASNERAIAVRYACSGQCGWSYAMRKGGYDPDFDILDGGTKVVVYRHVDGHESTTVTHYVDYQTMQDVVQKRPIAPLRLRFDETSTLQLSLDNKACAYRLSSKLVTGQRPYLDNSMTQSADGLLVRIGTGQGPAGGTCAPTFQLRIP